MSESKYLRAWLVSVVIACGVALALLVVFGPQSDQRWWIAATGLSAGWIYFNVVSRDPEWARTAGPSGVANVFALLYLLEHGGTPTGVTMAVVACLGSALHFYSYMRRRRMQRT